MHVTQENIIYIIAQYKNNVSSEKIAKFLKINGSTVCRILKRNGIKLRPATENKRTFDINQYYFSKIDNENKAYFLGFLYADGFLRNKGTSIRLTLHKQDIHILEKFSQEIYGVSNVKYDREYPCVYIYSKVMHADLIKLGCTPDKAFTITFPTTNIVPDNLMNHFIRGFFDGDGCISITSTPRIDITSNEQFLTEMINYIESKTDLKFNKLYISGKNGLSRSFQTKKKITVQGLIEYMYKNATIYLNRKYEKCMKTLNNYESYLDKNKIL